MSRFTFLSLLLVSATALADNPLFQASQDEIEHLGQTIGGIILAVLLLSFGFVAYKLFKRALWASDGYHSEPPNKDDYGNYNDWG